MIHLHTSICTLLNIKYPIIQAGMAGTATSDLAASVSSSGALGTIGAAYMTPDQMKKQIKSVKELTDKPFGVNLFCTNLEDEWEGIQQAQEVLNRFRMKLGIEGKTDWATPNLFDDQFQVLLDENVPVISTAFGILPEDKISAAKQKGAKTIAMATTVNEAVQAEKAGTDMIVAQGSDAGGHRGTFNVSEHPNGANIGTFSLVPQVVDHVSIPVIAAGGVMDGRGLVAALALGASGVQLGTAFLTTKESVAHKAYKQQLLESTEESTVITKSFSGRPARGIKNLFIKEFESDAQPLPFPSQNTLTSDIRKAAAEQNCPDYMSLWAGQGTRLLQPDAYASEVVASIMDKAKQILG